MNTHIELGDTVKHTVTGFVGTAIGRTEWLSGCDRIAVQPTIDKEGKLRENQSFDEPELVIVKKGKRKVSEEEKTGGPHTLATKREDTARR